MKSDLEIAREAEMYPIMDIAKGMGIEEDEVKLYGNYIAKIRLEALERMKDRPNGKYVVVTAINPTPLGEGKTVTTIGLGQALNYIGKKAINCIREPSMGPVFGIKGGAAGGGYAQAVPMEELNLHFTGDIHAVGAAHNLGAAMLDASIFHKNPLNIDPQNVSWRRVVDINDRALRNVVIGLGGKMDGIPRQTGFDITVASEIMAILALVKDLKDLRQRLGRMIMAYTYDGKPVTAEDVRCAGAMAALLKDAIMPNLIQTMEHTPVLVHAGPFANIAHGNSSILADYIALKAGEYVVTEAGFGADMGAEKFFNIKCRYSGLKPNAAVLVASIRALKMHGGAYNVKAGKIDKELFSQVNMEALDKGCENLDKQIENVRKHGIPVVVAINHFATDNDEELEFVRKRAIASGAFDAVISDVHAKGGAGGAELARAVVRACEQPSEFKFLYQDEASITEKIETIAREIYGADGVEYSPTASKQIKQYTDLGYSKLPICMAKTQYSLSHDPNLKGRPRGFTVPIREVRLSAGAGFLYPLLGPINTMPGLGSDPAGAHIDIDEDGNIVGLF